MQISSSDICMTSSSTLSKNSRQSEKMSLRFGKKPSPDEMVPHTRPSGIAAGHSLYHMADKVTLSSHGNSRKWQQIEAEAAAQSAEIDPEPSENAVADRFSLLKTLVEEMTGRTINVYRPGDALPQNTASETTEPLPPDGGQDQTDQGCEVSYDYRQSYTEVQTASFTAKGVIQTADGQSIKFSLSLSMSREYHEESSFSISAGDAAQKDPLVINFNGTAAQLTDTKFSFDLDADGNPDSMSFLKPGSGFLVLDKNLNATVDDGGELFGPKTGDGFAELAAYDEDGNNWIDENDSVYNQLFVWTQSDQDEDRLTSLQDAGVGAIYLSSAATLFDLKDADNQQLGQIAATGIYVNEAGGVQTIQHLNVAV